MPSKRGNIQCHITPGVGNLTTILTVEDCRAVYEKDGSGVETEDNEEPEE